MSQRQIKITYHSLEANKATERIIDPYFIEPAAPGHASYVIGYCHQRKEIRIFKIERISSSELTDVSYSIPTDFDANEYFASSWGIVVEDEVKTLKLEIKDQEIVRILNETIWHPSQKFEKQKDGSTLMTLQITGTYEFLAWILGWGEKVEVLEPQELREAIVRTIGAMLDKKEAGQTQPLSK